MRQLFIRVPRGSGARVLDLARQHRGTSSAHLEGHAGGEPVDLVLAHLPNGSVERFLDELEQLPDAHITLAPQGVITLEPPADEAAEQAIDVQARSPVEVFLGGLQSVGSWKGFLGYAAAGGVVVWIGLFTETSYLLTGAMLIAPFAGPAMNAALATARGDGWLLGRSLLRYAAALLVTIAVAFVLSTVLRQEIATTMMVDRSFISSVAVLLPITAGAAGALNLCQSDRSSLVSGAATGMLVAASLAPPAGLVGIGMALGAWDIVRTATFVLALQIVGINVSGAAVFHVYGITPRGARYARGKRWVGVAAWATAVALGVGLVTLQLWDTPSLRRSSEAQRATADARQAVKDSGLAKLVLADVRFTRADIPGQDTMLTTVHVQVETSSDEQEIERELEKVIAERLAREHDAVPLVNVVALKKRVDG